MVKENTVFTEPPTFDSTKERPMLIQRTSLVDQVCAYLRERIFNFDFKPGHSIQESKLMKTIGVSRSPIREALRILEGEGLLERNAQKGVIVKNISRREIQETYSILAVLEGLATELAIERLRKDDLDELNELCDKMRQQDEKRNYKQWAKHNHRFHKIIIKAADNLLLEKELKQYRSKTIWFMAFMAVKLQEQIFQQSHMEHKEIVDALVSRDSDLAVSQTKRHIKNAGETVVKAYQASEEE